MFKFKLGDRVKVLRTENTLANNSDFIGAIGPIVQTNILNKKNVYYIYPNGRSDLLVKLLEEDIRLFKEPIKKKPLIINLFGAPGAGKSTGAAYIFSKLKLMGFNAELATEYAKDKVYEETKEVFKNQVYIFGKQYFRISRLEDKVDIIVTDAPIPAALYYNDKESIEDILKDLTMTIFEEYNNLSFFVNRVKDYNPSGRLQDEEGSNQIGKELKDFLNELDISFEEIDGNIEGYDKIIWKIKDMYEVRLREWY